MTTAKSTTDAIKTIEKSTPVAKKKVIAPAPKKVGKLKAGNPFKKPAAVPAPVAPKPFKKGVFILQPTAHPTARMYLCGNQRVTIKPGQEAFTYTLAFSNKTMTNKEAHEVFDRYDYLMSEANGVEPQEIDINLTLDGKPQVPLNTAEFIGTKKPVAAPKVDKPVSDTPTSSSKVKIAVVIDASYPAPKKGLKRYAVLDAQGAWVGVYETTGWRKALETATAEGKAGVTVVKVKAK